ncbi:MAG: tRNA pseudouridine(13) synthase TruD, partial [Myxococcota bacterium]
MSAGAGNPPVATHWPTSPEDFLVEEIPLYAPTGEGGHTFVRVEKRLRNTEEVVRMLARAAGVLPRDVGYAGRKDKLALARQWFSVPGLDTVSALGFDLPGVRVLEATRHPHKLRTGQLRGNRFELRLREVEAESRRRACQAALSVARLGFPNRFGPRRFGRDKANPDRARAWLRGEARIPSRDRRRSRFLLSALQAAVFNDVLERRPLPLDRLECGDLAVVHASGGIFEVEDPALETPRAAAFEISATGPIFGTRVPRPGGEVGAREDRALERRGIPAH